MARVLSSQDWIGCVMLLILEDIYSRTYIEEYMKKGKPTKELVSIIYIYIYIS